MLQQNSGREAKTSGSGRGETARPFPLVDFISRWRQNGNGNESEMYLDEAPSSPLLPNPNRKRNSSPTTTSGNEAESEVFVPYPAPSAFLGPPTDGPHTRSSISSSDMNNIIESADEDRLEGGNDFDEGDEDNDDDDDDDDQQSIKSYDATRISLYDNRSLRLQQDEDRAEDHQRGGGSERNNLLSNFFSEASNFIAEQRSKFDGDKSKTRLKDGTEMKNLRWENDFFF